MQRKKKRKSKYTEIEKLAYQLGRIDCGLKNPDSRVSESYANGRKALKVKHKKSLF